MDYRISFGLIWTLILVASCNAYVDETDMRVCIGTNGRMSVPSNRNHHYRNLRDRFTNCTHVDGNLELTWLEDPKMDLDFLKHIREVTGYVLISHVHVRNIILPSLQIIRGRTLFKLNIYDEQFGLFVSYSQMDTLELPALRDILAGSVFIFNNQNLCHIQTITWDEIITGPREIFKHVYNFTFPEPVCPKCDRSCKAGCWGEGAHNCQVFSKTTCSPQCAQGRCFGPNPRDCCHLFCAGGCTGPTQKDCLACRNFYDDGVCKHECPPMQKYNPTNYLWEPNPEGKYAYGATCVRNCPEHLLKDNGACVRTCPINKTAKNGECVPCNGPCPKTCPGVGVVHSGNIDSFRDCTIIEGTLEILDQTFNGYHYEYVNPEEQGLLKPLASKAICRKCHPRCKRCTAYGFHSHICSECTGYKRGEQCEDECPTDHYADEKHRECNACHEECRGCHGSGPDNCIQCRNLKIYDGVPSDNSTMFNCTANCPKEFPHKVYSLDQPYCSSVPAISRENTETAETFMYLAIAFFILLFMFALLILSSLHCRRNAKIKKDAVNMTRVLAGYEDAEPLRPTNVGANLSKLMVIRENELSIGGSLGRGAFGEVYKGIWVPEVEKSKTKIPVAIKMLTMSQGYTASKEFLEEAYIMATVDHEHILRLLAVCMTEKMMLITQLMHFGSLLEYVKANKSKIGSYKLLNWSTQIAKGMAYLEDRRLVHRDLAARNVLVHNPATVKIADFGLAKLLSSDCDEYKAAGGRMPIKWLALECIRHRIFTTKSDVWAFGVTIWELLSFGGRPYENIKACDVPEKIEAGEKLRQPDICSLDVYCTLLSCWHIDADSRPSFKQLVTEFQKFASDPGRYLVIEGDTYCRSPQYTGYDDKDMIRTLARQQLHQYPIIDIDRITNARRLSQSTPGPSNVQPIANALRLYMRSNLPDNETDSNREIGLGNIKLDLPVDNDDYLIPTCQSESNGTPGYMELVGSPAIVENAEYLLNAMSSMQTPSTSSASSQPPSALILSPPTQTIGIPVMNSHPIENGEHDSDREYYNDLQRELQPLQTNETTV